VLFPGFGVERRIALLSHIVDYRIATWLLPDDSRGLLAHSGADPLLGA
jgi:hypothetical protein